MPNIRAISLRHQRQGPGQLLIEHLCSQAATNNQHPEPATSARQSLFGGVHRGHFAPHRIASTAGNRLVTETVRKRLKHRFGKTCEPTVGHSSDGVLFMDDQRLAHQPGGNTTRPRDKSAHAYHAVGADSAQMGVGFAQGAHQPERCQQQRQLAFTAQAGNVNERQRNIGVSNQTFFHAAAGAEPVHLVPPLLQRAGCGQRRKHMAAGATSHHQEATAR